MDTKRINYLRGSRTQAGREIDSSLEDIVLSEDRIQSMSENGKKEEERRSPATVMARD